MGIKFTPKQAQESFLYQVMLTIEHGCGRARKVAGI